MCTEKQDLEMGKRFNQIIEENNIRTLSKEHELILSSLLVKMYAKCGNIMDAQKVSLTFY